jgi:hypothetical protein
LVAKGRSEESEDKDKDKGSLPLSLFAQLQVHLPRHFTAAGGSWRDGCCLGRKDRNSYCIVQHVVEQHSIELFAFGGSQIATYLAVSAFEKVRWESFRELQWEAEFVQDDQTYRGEDFTRKNERLWKFIERVKEQSTALALKEDRIPFLKSLLSLGLDKDVQIHIDTELQCLVPEILQSVFGGNVGPGLNPIRALWLPFEQVGVDGQVTRKLFVFSPGATAGDEWRNVGDLHIDSEKGMATAPSNDEPIWTILIALVDKGFINFPTLNDKKWTLSTGERVVVDNHLRQRMSVNERDHFRTTDNAKLTTDYKSKVMHEKIAAEMQSE